jgi:hypothetical protein
MGSLDLEANRVCWSNVGIQWRGGGVGLIGPVGLSVTFWRIVLSTSTRFLIQNVIGKRKEITIFERTCVENHCLDAINELAFLNELQRPHFHNWIRMLIEGDSDELSPGRNGLNRVHQKMLMMGTSCIIPPTMMSF